jgi:hypothetical protein
VLVYGGQRRQAKAAADFLEAWRVAMLLDELVEVIENLALPFGKREHRLLLEKAGKCNRARRTIPARRLTLAGTIRKRKAKVNISIS